MANDDEGKEKYYISTLKDIIIVGWGHSANFWKENYWKTDRTLRTGSNQQYGQLWFLPW